jgi:hypothetical protein
MASNLKDEDEGSNHVGFAWCFDKGRPFVMHPEGGAIRGPLFATLQSVTEITDRLGGGQAFWEPLPGGATLPRSSENSRTGDLRRSS